MKTPKPPSHVGKKVNFGPRSGVIEDEVLISHKEYVPCAQLILWENDKYGIRLTYLHWNPKRRKWYYASRKALTSRPTKIRTFLKQVLARDWWLDEEQ